MLSKIKELLKKYWDIVIYLLFGILTTAANYVVFFLLHDLVGRSATFSNIVAWVAAVAVAYVTHKPFVFHSYDWSFKTVVRELEKFVTVSVGSGLMETLLLLLSVDIFHWNSLAMKLLVGVLVVVVNYIGSKWLVFKDE